MVGPITAHGTRTSSRYVEQTKRRATEPGSEEWERQVCQGGPDERDTRGRATPSRSFAGARTSRNPRSGSDVGVSQSVRSAAPDGQGQGHRDAELLGWPRDRPHCTRAASSGGQRWRAEVREPTTRFVAIQRTRPWPSPWTPSPSCCRLRWTPARTSTVCLFLLCVCGVGMVKVADPPQRNNRSCRQRRARISRCCSSRSSRPTTIPIPPGSPAPCALRISSSVTGRSACPTNPDVALGI